MNRLKNERANLMGELAIFKHKQMARELEQEEKVRKNEIIKRVMAIDFKLEEMASQIY